MKLPEALRSEMGHKTILSHRKLTGQLRFFESLWVFMDAKAMGFVWVKNGSGQKPIKSSTFGAITGTEAIVLWIRCYFSENP